MSRAMTVGQQDSCFAPRNDTGLYRVGAVVSNIPGPVAPIYGDQTPEQIFVGDMVGFNETCAVDPVPCNGFIGQANFDAAQFNYSDFNNNSTATSALFSYGVDNVGTGFPRNMDTQACMNDSFARAIADAQGAYNAPSSDGFRLSPTNIAQIVVGAAYLGAFIALIWMCWKFKQCCFAPRAHDVDDDARSVGSVDPDLAHAYIRMEEAGQQVFAGGVLPVRLMAGPLPISGGAPAEAAAPTGETSEKASAPKDVKHEEVNVPSMF